MTSIVNLTCEYRSNPLGIDVAAPRLSWQMQSKRDGARQTAYRIFAASGGVMSYGIDDVDQYRLAATYIDRILKGAKPADLPVQYPVKYKLVINLKAAKAIGLTTTETLLATADEVIQ